jgi:predicted metalloprotease with PDZ domain
VHGLAAVLATSPRARESNAALAAHVHDPGVLPLLVARGALYAARLDALVRQKSSGKRRLDDVLRTLYAQARDKRAALPEAAFREVVATEAGAPEADVFTAAIDKGAPIELPEGALGPCFRGDKRRYQLFDLGFDEEATRATSNDVIAALRPGGPAERAGVRAGDRLVDLQVTRGRSDVPVVITVERSPHVTLIRHYLPAGAAASGQGWARRKEVGDDACAK